ncbi:MFS transporter [Streptomyces sp. NPDC088864]|uniref:MFS transporter n=1 Tax=Streptomyces sp. NPDC088864 TaxID=3365910 RepID=UPI003801E0DE
MGVLRPGRALPPHPRRRPRVRPRVGAARPVRQARGRGRCLHRHRCPGADRAGRRARRPRGRRRQRGHPAGRAGVPGGVRAHRAAVRRAPRRLAILRHGPLVRANLSAMLFAAGFFGFQFLVVLYLQELRGWSTLETSFAMLVIGVDAVLSPTLTPRLVERFGNARVILGGLLLAVLAYGLFLPVGADWSYAAMFPSLILLGLAFSLAYGPLTIVATEGVAEEEQGLAGGLLYTAFQFGAAIGLSAVTAVSVAATRTDTPAGLLDGYRAGLLVPFAAAVAAAAVSAFGLRTRGGGTGPAPVDAAGSTEPATTPVAH